jgi:hypothetical protein
LTTKMSMRFASPPPIIGTPKLLWMLWKWAKMFTAKSR